MDIELLTIPLAAGEVRRFERAGRYFEIIDAAGALDVVFEADQGGQAGRIIAALSGTYVEDSFSAFTVKSETAQTLKVLVTDGRGGSRRQPGNVRVIDQRGDKTAAANQFILISSQSSATACKINGMRAGAKSARIWRLVVGSDSDGTIALVWAPSPPAVNAAATAYGLCKRIGEAPSLARVNNGDAVSLVPTGAELPGGTVWAYLPAKAGQPVELPLTTPIDLAPGQYIGLVAGAVGRGVNFMADFEEL